SDGAGRWQPSNFGEWVGAWSRGEDLSSTFVIWGSRWPWGKRGLEVPMGQPSPPAVPGRDRFTGWAVWSGTSFAAARVSGAIAAELKRDGRSPREVVSDLVR